MPTPTATETTTEPTHDLTLSDGVTTYGLISCDWKGRRNIRGITRNPTTQHAFKTFSGAQKWADVQPPYSAVSQDDWSGGLGVGEFERNTSGYKIAHGINTMSPNKAFLGPRPSITYGYSSMDKNDMSSLIIRTPITTAYTSYATKFTASASYTTSKVYVYVGPYGSPTTTDLTVAIYSDNAGLPNALLASATGGPTNTNILGEWWEYSIATALTSGTPYWVVVKQDNATSSKYWWVGGSASTGGYRYPLGGPAWATGGPTIWYQIMPTVKDYTAKFAEYKGCTYACLSFDDGTAPTLWRNGEQGCASSGTATTLVDTARDGIVRPAWTADALIGGIVKLVSGTGSTARVNYRTITDNDTNSITVSPAWDINPAIGTIYAITGLDKWEQVTSTSYLDATVTDVKSLNGSLYFCMGVSTSMDRFLGYKNGSNLWTEAWDHEDTTNAKFNYIEQIKGSNGTNYVYGAGANFVKKATSTDNTGVTTGSGSDFGTWGSAIYIGDYQTKIMGLEKYGSPQNVWVLKEDKIYEINEDKPIEIPLQEMTSVKSEDNGYAHTTQGVYLYFSLLRSMERYYNNNLDDINPQRDVGIPSDQRGAITAMVSYPGKIYFSIDAGTTGYSGIYVWDGVAFHEYYRGEYGKRIKSLFIQTIPGAAIDRLWLSEGNKIKWLPIALVPYDDTNYNTIPEGFLETSWIYSGMQDVYKTYKSLKIFSETYSNYSYINAYYMTDNGTTWTAISGDFDTIPSEEINLTTPVSCKRIKLGILFTKKVGTRYGVGTVYYYTPYLHAWILTGTVSLPVKYSYSVKFIAKDDAITLEGDDDNYTRVETLIDKLDAWAAAGTPLTLRSRVSVYDNKTVVVDPASVYPTLNIPDDQQEKMVGQLTLLEV